jgi:hypothetical protein
MALNIMRPNAVENGGIAVEGEDEAIAPADAAFSEARHGLSPVCFYG